MANRYNQRITADIVPMDITEDEDDDTTLPLVPHLKRNLLGDFGRPSVLEPPIPHEHMKVFLRVRPFSTEEKERNEDQQCLSIETDRTLITNAPKDSHFFKNMTRGSCRAATKFTFSHIFNDSTTQKEFFNSTMLGLVKDFIDGQNCLVFTYGVTSSGKTYTIQGNPKDAGILPRALDVLFNSINKRQWDGMDLKPKMFIDVTRLTPEQELMERKIKERVMKLSCDDDMDVMSLLGDDASDISSVTNITSCSETSNMSTVDGKDSLDGNDGLFEELESRIREEGKVSVDEQGQVKFSVWVSFAEIYNEQIFDLLELVPPKKKNYRRPCLKLSEDKNGSPYIKGLKHIQVNSADEAYKLLTIGQKNLQTACTKLNHNSSRSHCIFNIKIIRVIDKDNPHAARVSMLSLCDLAGSERHGKTQTTGDRLKEAGNINTSLLTLGRCIETLRHNQAHKENSRIIPFRESKLTRLFQNFFVGQGKAAMIVNVNQLASMFDETMHVFKFSAIASKVEVQQKPVFIKPKLPLAPAPAHIPRTSISWATPARNNTLKQREAENVPLPELEDDDLEESETEEQIYTQENIDELLGIIEQLQTDLENEIHSKYKQEKMIRKEVCEEMMKQFTEIEEQYSERIRVREQRAEELAEKRLKIVLDAERAKRKDMMNDGEDEWVSSMLLHQEKIKVEKKDEIIKGLKEEINTLKEKESTYETKLKDLTEKVGSYENRIKDLEDQLEKEREHNKEGKKISKMLSEYEEKIKSLEEELVKKEERNVEDSSNADLVENLTQQLQQARQHIKEQEQEVSELNDMLTEAGETFEQKQSEIDKLKELTQEYETRMETQAEAIKVLERAASDSKVAMDTADQSLSKREECVANLQAEIRNLEGTEKEEIVLESPLRHSTNTPCLSDKVSTALDKFRQSISALDFSYTQGSSEKIKDRNSSHKIESYHADSSGVVADCDSEDLSDTEVFFNKAPSKADSKNKVIESESKSGKSKIFVH
ncbi:kinesin-like protein KIF20A [Ruditapes philippinarum]|uniref:kinesin-like protein KIF20A n=1 Tax=Ruditapes philippinarum TaxID=129788 RepID=UPI00295A8BD5|nr:kinesin-like protein KIF20A [Ruditapes philippinarum]XP_060582780.1 kinesin-like protein KIF20A [Ruditapes philippinarum]